MYTHTHTLTHSTNTLHTDLICIPFLYYNEYICQAQKRHLKKKSCFSQLHSDSETGALEIMQLCSVQDLFGNCQTIKTVILCKCVA